MTPQVTPEAVRELLTAAGFVAAETDGSAYQNPITDGFTTMLLPMAVDVVAVTWHHGYGDYDEAYIHEPSPVLGDCAEVLAATGYRTEFVADFPAGYIEAWTGGDL